MFKMAAVMMMMMVRKETAMMVVVLLTPFETHTNLLAFFSF
jgi:hypothetical protein